MVFRAIAVSCLANAATHVARLAHDCRRKELTALLRWRRPKTVIKITFFSLTTAH
jgi:hypothetical protein